MLNIIQSTYNNILKVRWGGSRRTKCCIQYNRKAFQVLWECIL